MNARFNIFLLTLISVLLFACSKDPVTYNYTGKWVSEVYATTSVDSNAVVQQRYYDFSDEEFEDIIFEGETENTLSEMYGISGSMTNTAFGNAKLKIKAISLKGGSFFKELENRDEFDELFDSLISKFSYKSYTVIYSFNGDDLILALPEKGDTLGSQDKIRSLSLSKID